MALAGTWLVHWAYHVGRGVDSDLVGDSVLLCGTPPNNRSFPHGFGGGVIAKPLPLVGVRGAWHWPPRVLG